MLRLPERAGERNVESSELHESAASRSDTWAGASRSEASFVPGARQGAASRRRRTAPTRGGFQAALWGLALCLLVIVLACVLGPTFTPDPSATQFGALLRPSATHPLGTDELGRDVLARVLDGGRGTLLVGVSVPALCLIIGTAVGGVGGFVGGLADLLAVKIGEVFQVIPAIVLALVAVALLGSTTWIVIVILSLTMWPSIARIARAECIKASQMGYVESARTGGFSRLHIFLSDVLPNVAPPILVATTMTVGRAILLQSGLAFLGLGDANHPTWGALLSEGQRLMQGGWWLSVFPGFAIFLVVMTVNLIGDLLTDRLNPLRGRVK